MPKFALSSSRTSNPKAATTATAAAVAKSTPLIHLFAEKIMAKYMQPESDDIDLDESEAAVQELFNSWPGDETSTRLAKLVNVLTGFNPKLPKNTTTIGDTFAQNGTVYVAVYVSNGTVYALNNACNGYVSVPMDTALKNMATQAQTGQFAKDLLKVEGIQLLAYMSSALGQPATKAFLKELGGSAIV